MTVPESASEILDVNTRYHDAAAAEYDVKWGIDFGELGQSQVAAKLRKALGGDPGNYTHALEIGAGTGYFSLNLMQGGIVDRATCTDVSPGMLDALSRNAARIGLSARVATRVCDAERLPFDDGSFDLVLGHAVLHHIPDLDAAFGEFHRVLRPGGTLVFAGEPSTHGDRVARVPKAMAAKAAPLWRIAMRAKPFRGFPPAPDAPRSGNPDDHALESIVDVHTFIPRELSAVAQRHGFQDVNVRGEELLANWFGWTNRTLEASAAPESIPWLWRQYAYRGYLALQTVDAALLERRLPPAIFYNLLIAARRP